MRAALLWLEERIGLSELGARLALRDLPGGPSWARASGVALLGLIGLQLLTGSALALHYAPTTTDAWASVRHLEEEVPGGALLRALHAAGASGIVLLLGLHLLLAGFSTAYRRPRELVWAIGLALVPLLLAFGLTGYLLPWDQRGYWATTVALGIARSTPLVGEAAARVLQGGPELTSLTLTRFYGLHALLLPAALLVVVALHLRARTRADAALRAAGVAGEPWWPGQAARDLPLLLVGLLGVGAAALLHAPGLEAPADPGITYPPRPEWWFLPLRELLKTVPEPWGSVVLPGLLGAVWLLLPWLDPAERPRPRLRAALLGLPALAWVLLLGRAVLHDRTDLEYLGARETADQDAALARELAKAGVPPEGPAALLERHPPRRGARLFAQHCQECHALRGKGGEEGPDLTGYLSDEWLSGVIRDPRAPKFFGRVKGVELTMEALPREQWGDLEGLVAFLAAQQDEARARRLDPAKIAAGEEAYTRLDCLGCHPISAGEEGIAANLLGYGSEGWLTELLKDPAHPLFYGESYKDQMPAYAKELSQEELKALVVFLRGLRGP